MKKCVIKSYLETNIPMSFLVLELNYNLSKSLSLMDGQLKICVTADITKFSHGVCIYYYNNKNEWLRNMFSCSLMRRHGYVVKFSIWMICT